MVSRTGAVLRAFSRALPRDPSAPRASRPERQEADCGRNYLRLEALALFFSELKKLFAFLEAYFHRPPLGVLFNDRC